MEDEKKDEHLNKDNENHSGEETKAAPEAGPKPHSNSRKVHAAYFGWQRRDWLRTNGYR